MIRRATNLIAETLDRRGILYRIRETDDASWIEVLFEVEAGPEAVARFISSDENNDVAFRIYGLVHKVPDAKRAAVLEACNALCTRIRFFKFLLDSDASVNVEADLPIRTDDECLGECCFELLARSMNILDREFHVLAEAIYGCGGGEKERPLELLRLLSELREKPLAVKDGETA